MWRGFLRYLPGMGSDRVIYGHPLHKKSVQKALDGIVANVTEDGTVKNVSAGTAVMLDLEAYKNVPRKRVQGWGQGLTLAFLAALLKYKP